MAAISSPGIGSGLDIGGLVSQLVAAEGEPASLRLARQEARAQAEISGLGSLKSSLSGFRSALEKLQDLSDFRQRSASSSNEELFTATVNESAVPGRFDIEVVALAEAQKLVSTGFADAATTVGSGTITLSTGTSSFQVTIGAGADSLAEIREAINLADDNPGISATIIKVDDGGGGTESKLVLAADSTGTDNAITITVDDDDNVDDDGTGLSALVYDPDGSGVTNMGVLQGAVDAQIKFGTETVTRSTNSINDAIEGVSISLHSASPGDTAALEVALDKEGVKGAVDDFVGAYNNLVQTIAGLSSYDPVSGQAGLLLGDATLRNVESTLRRALGAEVDGISGAFNSLSALGITTTKSGTLTVDSTILDAAVSGDFEAVGDLFASQGGVANRLYDLMSPYVQVNGTIDLRTQGLNERIGEIADQRETLERRLASMQDRLLAQFIAMDSIVGQLQSTSNFLNQQLSITASIAKGTGGGN